MNPADGVFLWQHADESMPCPRCGAGLPGDISSTSKRTIKVAPEWVDECGAVVRPACFVEREVRHRICATASCPQEVLLFPVEHQVGWAFACHYCGCFGAHVDTAGCCLACMLERRGGLYDARGLFAGAGEAQPYISPSRNDLLEGLLHGLLSGAPGLTCQEPKRPRPTAGTGI